MELINFNQLKVSKFYNSCSPTIKRVLNDVAKTTMFKICYREDNVIIHGFSPSGCEVIRLSRKRQMEEVNEVVYSEPEAINEDSVLENSEDGENDTEED